MALGCPHGERGTVKRRLAFLRPSRPRRSATWLSVGQAKRSEAILAFVLGTVKRCSVVLPAIHAQHVSALLSFQPNERSALLFGRPSSKPSAVRFILLLLELTKQSAILLVVPRSGGLFVRGRYSDLSTSLLW